MKRQTKKRHSARRESMLRLFLRDARRHYANMAVLDVIAGRLAKQILDAPPPHP
jgi:hypothetical protein